MILKLGGLNHGEHVRSGTLSIISHFKDYVHNNHKIKNRASDATVSACKVLTVNRRL